MVTPYLPSARWFRGEETPTRKINRTWIDSETLLTVPITGGASFMKRSAPDSWMISPHGNWRHLHIGAIDTLLRRTPFYVHYFPGIREIILSRPDQSPFEDLTSQLEEFISSALSLPDMLPRLRNEAAQNPVVGQYATEIKSGNDLSLSMVTHLMRLGPDAIFLLV